WVTVGLRRSACRQHSGVAAHSQSLVGFDPPLPRGWPPLPGRARMPARARGTPLSRRCREERSVVPIRGRRVHRHP
ncbi:hypothetical protein, partial [Ralstonia pseudosolanacearum]|uniref:hypothetical protein n=1 Tax=Ralstonia pseudosolanacearum TaxID=1310165 RepID=UPI001E4132EF